MRKVPIIIRTKIWVKVILSKRQAKKLNEKTCEEAFGMGIRQSDGIGAFADGLGKDKAGAGSIIGENENIKIYGRYGKYRGLERDRAAA